MLSQALFNHKLDAITSNETNQLQTSEYSSAGSVSSTNGSTSPSNKNVTNTNVHLTENDKDPVESTNINNNTIITDGNSFFIESSDEIREFEHRWGYNIADLFDICLKFYKNNESKAFHPTFDQRNRLNALIIQAKHGKYDEKKMPEIGVLDLVGKNRRHQWSLLGDMSKLEAKYRFILIIDEICPLFKAFVEAIRLDRNDDSLNDSSNSSNAHTDNQELKQQSDNQSYNSIDNNDRSTNDDAASNRKALDDPNEAAQTLQEQQNKAIYEILCKQTYEQFSNYAYNQYPNEETKREYLVQKLQLQYYNQYMQQVYQQQQQTAYQTSSPVASDPMQHSHNQSSNRTTEEVEILDKDARKDDPCSSSCSSNRDVIYEAKVDDLVETTANIDINQDKSSSDSLADTDHTGDDEGEHEEHDEDDDWPIDSLNPDLIVATPSLWTRNTIDEFKESIRNEGRSGIFVVHFGEFVIVRAPTHPNGKSIYWEFATDNFDIGFGVLFQFDKDPTKDQVQTINYNVDGDAGNNTDEDDNQNYISSDREKCDIENGIFKDDNINSNTPPPPSKNFTSTVVIPVYRRDSHEEVYAGRHDYPGQGVYLLKFDNTYSKLRSKTVYYRVCYYPHYEPVRS